MKKSVLLITLILLFSLHQIPAKTNITDNDSIVQLNFGGSFKGNFNIFSADKEQVIQENAAYYRIIIRIFEFTPLPLFSDNYFFSVIYNPFRKFGLGLIHEFRTEVLLDYNSPIIRTIIINKFRVINKFRIYKKNSDWFIFEYGIAVMLLINLEETSAYLRHYYHPWFLNNSPATLDNSQAIYGPSLFFGYDFKYSDKNTFVAGLSCDIYMREKTYYYHDTFSDTYTSLTAFESFLQLGFELRWQFNYKPYIKKSIQDKKQRDDA